MHSRRPRSEFRFAEICPHCRTRIRIAEDIEHRLSENESALFEGMVWAGTGCDECNGSSHHGRIGFFELLRINPKLRRAIAENKTAADLRAASTLVSTFSWLV